MKNSQVIQINVSTSLEAILSIPDDSTSIIIFAHGSGSGAKSSRSQTVAQILNDNGLGTLLFDLLTKEEQESDVRTQRIIHELPGVTLNVNLIVLGTRGMSGIKRMLLGSTASGVIIYSHCPVMVIK